MHKKPVNADEKEDFFLVLGGPLYQLLLRTQLVRPPLDLVYRRVLASISGQSIGIHIWGVELNEHDLASQQFIRHMGFKALPATDESRGWFGKEDAVVMTRSLRGT